MRYLLAFVASMLLVSCDALECRLSSDDERIQTVLFAANLNLCDCVDISDISLEPPIELGPPGMIGENTFENVEVKAAIRSMIKENPEPEDFSLSTTWGKIPKGPPDYCGYGISRPVTRDNMSIVKYSAPSGTIAVIAFKRTNGAWQEVERKHLGWW